MKMSHIFSLRRSTVTLIPQVVLRRPNPISVGPKQHRDADILSALVEGMGTSGERVRANMSAFVSQTVHLIAKAPAKAGARGRAVRLPTDPAPRSPPRPAPRHELTHPLDLRRRSRAQAPRAVRCEATGPATTGRRSAALGLGAAFIAGFSAAGKAQAVECSMIVPCMPGTEPGAPPRYVLPGAAYSPAEAAEVRFREKIRAERAAEKAAYEAQYKREEAAAAAAVERAAAEAAAAP